MREKSETQKDPNPLMVKESNKIQIKQREEKFCFSSYYLIFVPLDYNH